MVIRKISLCVYGPLVFRVSFQCQRTMLRVFELFGKFIDFVAKLKPSLRVCVDGLAGRRSTLAISDRQTDAPNTVGALRESYVLFLMFVHLVLCGVAG